MRSFSIAIVFVIVCGCAKAPYFNLNQPIYFEAENSFWAGCDKDPVGERACREDRIDQVYKGFSQWSNYFDKTNRPQAVFVLSDKELPASHVNRVIYLGISDTFCGKIFDGRDAGGCYFWSAFSLFSPTKIRIVLKNINNLSSIQVAHEVGHAFGRDDNDVPEGTGSVMSYKIKVPVTPLDVKMMCKLHRECRMVKRKQRKH